MGEDPDRARGEESSSRRVIDSQKAYAEQIVPFKLSWFPPYNFAGEYYWKNKIYLTKK